jgi:hypothetical protein
MNRPSMQLDSSSVLLLVKMHFLLLAELCLVAGLILLSALLGAPRWLQSVGRWWREIARRPVLPLLLPAVAVIALRLLLLPLAEVPYPQAARDEFSYLLAADTFASGRLTNPPHAHFQSFQSPHIIFQPTYASKYPPGQALALGAGEWLLHPWLGVLLSVAALIIAAGWAARAWLPPPYALLATTLLALRIGVMSYWTNSYWGGAVAATGGALLLGALPRLDKRPKLLAGVLLGLGLGILALSRPLEGLIYSAAALSVWAFPFFRAGGARRLRRLLPALGCGAMVVTAILFWLAYYQYAVTGDPFTTPYRVWLDTHQSDGLHALATPVNAGYKRFFEWTSQSVQEYSSLSSRAARMGFIVVSFFWCPILAVFIVASGPWLLTNRRVRLVTLAVLAPLLIWLLGMELWVYSHYLAPLTAAMTILGVQAIRIFVAGVRRRFPRLRLNSNLLLAGLPALLLVLNLVGLFLRNTDRLWTTPSYETGWCCFPALSERARVERILAGREGRHLVFVRNPPEGFAGTEWVYNGASIDDAKIVWAREISPDADCALRGYYPQRQVWVTYVGETPARAVPFPDPSCGTLDSSPRMASQ